MVQKITIGISGAESKCGCTHMCLLIANFLRNRNYKTAIVQCNSNSDFEEIQNCIGQELNAGQYFLFNRIHFYPYVNAGILRNITNGDYSFVVYDFGSFASCDKMMFAKCDIPIIICGSKPWETAALNNVFEQIEEQYLKDYNFYFNFCSENKQSQDDIKAGMGVLQNIFFPPYVENPFMQECFPGAETLLAGVFEKEETPKKEKQKKEKQKKSLIPFHMGKEELPHTDKKAIKETKEVIEEIPKDVPEDDEVPMPAKPEKNVSEKMVSEKVTSEKTESKPAGKHGFIKFGSMAESIVGTFAGFAQNEKKTNFVPAEIEDDTLCKNLSYTLPDMKKVLGDSMEVLREIPKITDSTTDFTENADMLQMLAYSIFRNSYCSVIRAGISPRRTNAKDGSPLLLLPANNKEIACAEADIKKILGKDAAIIKPFEDTYVEV